jgi:hypothetical protein
MPQARIAGAHPAGAIKVAPALVAVCVFTGSVAAAAQQTTAIGAIAARKITVTG